MKFFDPSRNSKGGDYGDELKRPYVNLTCLNEFARLRRQITQGKTEQSSGAFGMIDNIGAWKHLRLLPPNGVHVEMVSKGIGNVLPMYVAETNIGKTYFDVGGIPVISKRPNGLMYIVKPYEPHISVKGRSLFERRERGKPIPGSVSLFSTDKPHGNALAILASIYFCLAYDILSEVERRWFLSEGGKVPFEEWARWWRVERNTADSNPK